MAHYGMLRDYAFAGDIDDIRGADLYAADGKIGTVKDVIFDHDNGDIRYLVADLGHDRRVLIDSGHVFRSTADEDSFETDLTAGEASRLPRFDETALEAEHDWERHHEENRKLWKEREEAYEKEYKRAWDEDPVMHQKGSANIITPEVVPAEGSGERTISGADLTPHRIADKFNQMGPMTNVSTNLSGQDVTLRPAGTASHAEGAAFNTWTRSDRLRNFQTSVRERMPELRKTCCFCPGGARRVA